MLSRYGAIYPSQSEIDKLSKLSTISESLTSSVLCEDDEDLLQKWKWDENIKSPEDLSTEVF